MYQYRISNQAREDLIRIRHYSVEMSGMSQADKYFNAFFEHFEIISQRPYSFEAVNHIKEGYKRCTCGVDSIYYRIQNDTIEKMAIIGRQDFNNFL